MAPKALIIVESPAKARTISKYLGKDFVVESSIGHIRDLPSKADEIPAEFKKKPWARTGVDVEHGFKPLYIVPAQKRAQVKKLKDLLAKAQVLYLATDEDREGEAIAWHLNEVLDPKVPVKRMVFHEITEDAIQAALANPRELDGRLVEAQEARRILDRLYGYEVSPVLWKKVRPRLSAGRVQSVATRLIVERELQRMAFHAGDYYGLQGVLELPRAAEQVRAELAELGGRRLAIGKDFDPASGQLSEAAKKSNVLLLGAPGATALEQALTGATFTVDDVQKKPVSQRPAPPFITSTLQQEAARKLRFTAQRAMRTAQRLYENGYITYMRTDSTTLSAEAVKAARSQIEELYGVENLPDAPRTYTKKAKGAQEAHEAIRPAGNRFRKPDELRGELDEEAIKLYDLIWKRTVASQMKDSQGESTRVRFRAAVPDAVAKSAGISGGATTEAVFTASGKVITFAGFLRAYVEGSDDPDQELEEKERILPAMAVGDQLAGRQMASRKSTTQPPARYTEASLVKELEERGIGRPSTYASIIQTIQDRGYVWKKSGALVPTLTALAVVRLLEKHFMELVDYEFTARMEDDLDAISAGEKRAEPWLEQFYFGDRGKSGASEGVEKGPLGKVGLRSAIGAGVEDIDARAICSLEVGRTADGQTISARVGRYGPYLQVADTDRRANLPEDLPPDELDSARAGVVMRQADLSNRKLGEQPVSGLPIYLKTGRFGPYVQLGDPELTAKGAIKKGSKPRMASLHPGMSVENITLENAVYLLSFPKVLGKHPESHTDVVVQDGQFGPYVSREVDGKRDSRSLENHEQLKTFTLDDAIALFKEPPRRGGRKQRGPIASLGTSAVTGKAIEVRTGRFGPYVTDGQVNATIPSGRDPASLSLDDGLELIAQREERMRAMGKEPRPAAKGVRTKKAPAVLEAAEPKQVAAKRTTKAAAPKKPKAPPKAKAPAKAPAKAKTPKKAKKA